MKNLIDEEFPFEILAIIVIYLALMVTCSGCAFYAPTRHPQETEKFEYFRGYILHYNTRGRMTVLTESDLRLLGIDSLATYHNETKTLREPF